MNNLLTYGELKCPDKQLECLLKDLLIKYLSSIISTNEGNALGLDAEGKIFIKLTAPVGNEG